MRRNLPLKPDELPCMTEHDQLYSAASDRHITGVEKLAVQGMTRGRMNIHGMKDAELCDIAGNGYSLPCLDAILVAFFSSASWEFGEVA